MLFTMIQNAASTTPADIARGLIPFAFLASVLAYRTYKNRKGGNRSGSSAISESLKKGWACWTIAFIFYLAAAAKVLFIDTPIAQN